MDQFSQRLSSRIDPWFQQPGVLEHSVGLALLYVSLFLLLEVNLDVRNAFLKIRFGHWLIKVFEESTIEEICLSLFNSEFFQTYMTTVPLLFSCKLVVSVFWE